VQCGSTIFHLAEFICKSKFKAQRWSGVATGYSTPWGKKHSCAPSQQKFAGGEATSPWRQQGIEGSSGVAREASGGAGLGGAQAHFLLSFKNAF